MRNVNLSGTLFFRTDARGNKIYELQVKSEFLDGQTFEVDGYEPSVFDLDQRGPISVEVKVRSDRGGRATVIHDPIVLGTPSTPKKKWHIRAIVLDENGTELGKDIVIQDKDEEVIERPNNF